MHAYVGFYWYIQLENAIIMMAMLDPSKVGPHQLEELRIAVNDAPSGRNVDSFKIFPMIEDESIFIIARCNFDLLSKAQIMQRFLILRTRIMRSCSIELDPEECEKHDFPPQLQSHLTAAHTH